MIEPIFKGESAVICATGPSVTQSVIDLCNEAKRLGKVRLFGMNSSYQYFDVDLTHSCNYQYYDYYYNKDKKLRDGKFFKFTTRPELKDRYFGVEYIREEWLPGLSTDPTYIHAHHGSSPQVLNLALHFGIKKMFLVGFDMAYRAGKPRHHFGEYPLEMQHWTRNLGPNGELVGLIKEYETINPSDYGIEIYNCTPDSALTHFPFMDLEEAING